MLSFAKLVVLSSGAILTGWSWSLTSGDLKLVSGQFLGRRQLIVVLLGLVELKDTLFLINRCGCALVKALNLYHSLLLIMLLLLLLSI